MRAVMLGAVVAVATVLAGCSSSESPAPAPSSPSTTTAPTGHGSFAHCLSEHGVPAAPGPTAGPPPGVSQDTWDKAMKACATLAPGPAS